MRRPSDEEVVQVKKTFLNHQVIFFREQDLSPAQFLAFAERFGRPIEYPFVKGLDDYPVIIPVLKLARMQPTRLIKIFADER